ncbi:hypothetical protein O6H91_23G005000 [Diphasiastrum complanatum]|uniref:Uncharacterized protein n=1 Tax=Diphasiastrum complanatum TaxID=34168 RepID=A0ACC2A7V5_DIPCM|nr:hypothetical protein O6H91_23G005000 [Diphasiastrum complanatum]
MDKEVSGNSDPCLTFVEHQRSYNASKCKNKKKRMSARALLDACQKLLESFTDRADASDDHCAVVLPSSNAMHPSDVLFVKQVLCGCCRYKGLLDAFISKLYSHKGAHLQPQDKNLYIVLAYLIFIHLEELTFPNFRKLVFSHAQKVLPLLQFIFNFEELIEHCKVAWLKIYDIKVFKWLPDATELMKSLEERIYGKHKRGEIMRTSPQPFKLSTSKSKLAEKEVRSSKKEPFKAKPAPVCADGPTLTQKRLEVMFNENKRIQAEYYSHPKHQPFQLHILERPSNLESIRKQVELKIMKENEFIRQKSHPCPASPSTEIKSTTATILREHSLYQKQIDAEKSHINTFELELRDGAAFKAWKKEMRIRAEAAETLNLQFKKAAVVATAQAILDARVFKEALAKVLEERRERAHKIQVETIELMSEMAAKHTVELQIKQELVCQLRALELESAHIVRTFDRNSIAGHQVLTEMSINELQERLALMKTAFKHKEDCRRSSIAASKEEVFYELHLDCYRSLTDMLVRASITESLSCNAT